MKEDNIYNEEDAMMESEEMCATRFDDIFDMALIASHRMCIAKNKVINRERYAILERVCDGILTIELFDNVRRLTVQIPVTALQHISGTLSLHLH